jgi:hypothetical protein
MTPGVAEEAGQTARSFIDALKTQPAVLALIISNLLLLGFMFYALRAGAQFRQDMIKDNFTYQREISQLLARCVVPEKPPG